MSKGYRAGIDYPAEYDDVPVCDGCGDEYVIDGEGTNETPSIEGECCSWECYAIKLKVQNAELRKRMAAAHLLAKAVRQGLIGPGRT